MVECEDRVVGKMYAKVAFQFMTKLVEVSASFHLTSVLLLMIKDARSQTEEGTARREVLKRQGELVATLSQRAKDLRLSKDARPKKIDKLRAFIMDSKNALSPLPSPLPLPLNPRIEVTGIAAERSSVFKSNLFPLLLWFQSNSESGEYPIIFKNGDDLRQDQLVIQLFTLMDRLLRKENLDLKLSPYAVMATGTSEGMIQFVPSKSLAVIMGEYGSLLNYLKVDHADEGAIGSLGIEPAVLDTFIRSCGKRVAPSLAPDFP
jgi:phosphatidylinositol 3-kinase